MYSIIQLSRIFQFVPGIDIEKELETTLNEPESNSSDSVPEDVVVRNDDDDVINTLDVKLRVLRVRFSFRFDDFLLLLITISLDRPIFPKVLREIEVSVLIEGLS